MIIPYFLAKVCFFTINQKIADQLASKICKDLGVPDIKKGSLMEYQAAFLFR